jgi:hypothetical protein
MFPNYQFVDPRNDRTVLISKIAGFLGPAYVLFKSGPGKLVQSLGWSLGCAVGSAAGPSERPINLSVRVPRERYVGQNDGQQHHNAHALSLPWYLSNAADASDQMRRAQSTTSGEQYKVLLMRAYRASASFSAA